MYELKEHDYAVCKKPLMKCVCVYGCEWCAPAAGRLYRTGLDGARLRYCFFVSIVFVQEEYSYLILILI